MIAYVRSVSGKQVDDASKAAIIALPPLQAASIKYKTILNMWYGDIATQLATGIQAHITSSAKAEFKTAPAPIIIPVPLILAPLLAKPSITSKTVDSEAKGQTATLQGATLASAGDIIYPILFKYIFADFVDVFSVAISTALNSALVIAPAGSAAPPCATTFAPAPALLIKPFVPAALASLLQINGFNPAMAQTLGTDMSSTTKAQTATADQNLAGGIIWDLILTKLSTHMIDVLTKSIKQYITTSGPSWAVPAGIPGAPVTPAGPTPSALMPYPNSCA